MNFLPTTQRAHVSRGHQSLRDFARIQRSNGRADLPPEFVRFWRSEHQRFRKASTGAGNSQDSPNELLAQITHPLNSQFEDSTLTYDPYVEIRVVEAVLGRAGLGHAPGQRVAEWLCGDQTPTDGRAVRRILGQAGYCLLHDLWNFERVSLSDPSFWRSRESFDFNVAQKRELALTELIGEGLHTGSLVEVDSLPVSARMIDEPLPTKPIDLDDPWEVLVELTGFPQTRCHEEFAFLRTIQIAEVHFLALQSVTLETIGFLRTGELENAARTLSDGTALVKTLRETFASLNFMHPEQFWDFREATGQASAIQSLNYQYLDCCLRGFDDRKRPYLERFPQFATLLTRTATPFPCLKEALRSPQLPKSAEGLRVLAKAVEMDCQLKKWRGLHLSFAKKYLPADRIDAGDAPGAAYLIRFLNEGFLPANVESCQSRLKDLGPAQVSGIERNSHDLV